MEQLEDLLVRILLFAAMISFVSYFLLSCCCYEELLLLSVTGNIIIFVKFGTAARSMDVLI